VAERARLVIFGAFLMVAIVFLPEGFRGLWRRARTARAGQAGPRPGRVAA
jgi:ABC-type branched-subunit amino acid transport system permease subunit